MILSGILSGQEIGYWNFQRINLFTVRHLDAAFLMMIKEVEERIMYELITPPPANHLELSSQELSALIQVWRERKGQLENDGAYHDFLRKLQREWAIETGIIERLYTWDRGITEVLIEQGIDSTLIAHRGGLHRNQAEHVKDIIDDQLATIDSVFAFVKNEQSLTEHFIRSLHAQFTAHQDYTDAKTIDGKTVRITLRKGAYKLQPNNPRRDDGTIHEYCPPELVNDEMQRLVQWYDEWKEELTPEVLSAWLHHRFTQIHPFQDGNGRVARALATLVCLKEGVFPLVIRDSDRDEYLSALEKADAGELKDLTSLFARRQRDSILRALGVEQQTRQEQYADKIISSAIQILKDRFKAEVTNKERVYQVSEKLRAIAHDRFNNISSQINQQFSEVTGSNKDLNYHAWARTADHKSPQSHYFWFQVVEIAKHFGYFASFERYRSWVQLGIVTDTVFELVVSFHGYGHGANGVLAASAFTALRVEQEGGTTRPINTIPASTDLFQFNYAEEDTSIENRFIDWLDHVIAIALGEWRRNLDA